MVTTMDLVCRDCGCGFLKMVEGRELEREPDKFRCNRCAHDFAEGFDEVEYHVGYWQDLIEKELDEAEKAKMIITAWTELIDVMGNERVVQAGRQFLALVPTGPKQ